MYQQLNKSRRWAKHCSNTTYAVNFLAQSLAWFWPRLTNIFQNNSWVLFRHYHKPGILPTAQFGCNQIVSGFNYVDVRPGGADGFWAMERVLGHFFTNIGVSSECNENRICAQSWQVSILNWTLLHLCYGHNTRTVRVKLLDVYSHASTITICLGLFFYAWKFFPHICQAAHYLLPWISWLLCPFPAVWPSARFWRQSCSSAPFSSEFIMFSLLLSSSVGGSFLPCAYSALSHLVFLLHYTHLRNEPP